MAFIFVWLISLGIMPSFLSKFLIVYFCYVSHPREVAVCRDVLCVSAVYSSLNPGSALCLWTRFSSMLNCSLLASGVWLPGGRGQSLPTSGQTWAWVLWWTGPHQGVCLEVTVSSESLLVACLLISGSVFQHCWLFGLRHPSAGTYRCSLGPGLGAKMLASWYLHHQCSCP